MKLVKYVLKLALQVKMMLLYRDGGTLKRPGGQTRTKGTSVDLQLCVDLPMKA
jgi:hypothetical protein